MGNGKNTVSINKNATNNHMTFLGGQDIDTFITQTDSYELKRIDLTTVEYSDSLGNVFILKDFDKITDRSGKSRVIGKFETKQPNRQQLPDFPSPPNTPVELLNPTEIPRPQQPQTISQ